MVGLRGVRGSEAVTLARAMRASAYHPIRLLTNCTRRVRHFLGILNHNAGNLVLPTQLCLSSCWVCRKLQEPEEEGSRDASFSRYVYCEALNLASLR